MRKLLFALAILLAQLSGVRADERITSFFSDVIVNTDGSLDVTETIEVEAEGDRIKRGIFRDFPTRYKDSNGWEMNVGFSVAGVKRDGNEEPYSVESITRGKRIRIGDKDVFLEHGKHRYEINYTTTRQIGFFKDYDELYWNVTGNGWPFPIGKVRARITLPQNVKIIKSAAYTGAFGESGGDYDITADGNIIYAKATRILREGEGLTVAVAWPKGIVTPPNATRQRMMMLRDNLSIILLILGFFGVALYYLYAWNRVGRDPQGKQIIPLFHPPKDLGPAATRFVWRHRYDERTFATALLGLATQNWVKIGENDDDEFYVEPQKRFGDVATLPEKTALTTIGGQKLWLNKENRERILKINEALEDTLEKTYHGVMFNRNRLWFWAGAALSVCVLVLSALFLPDNERETALFSAAFFSVFASIVLSLVWRQLRAIGMARGLFKKIATGATLIFFVPYSLSFVVPAVAAFESGYASPTLIAFFGVAVVLAAYNLLFANLLYAPTQAGRWVMDEIEGFRMYMTAAEEERLKVLHPPEKTPELFERYLPYAMALDCENEWNAQFESVLAAAAAEKGDASPSWYSGRSWNSSSTGAFASTLSSTLISSVATASASSSSGSGGGGFSGGGGGGGGGGGW